MEGGESPKMIIEISNQKKKVLRSFQDLEVYQKSFELAMEIFRITKDFPKEELYALTTQMRNASRSVFANIAEGWAKRLYPAVFKRHLLDALGSANEVLAWLETALACGYMTQMQETKLIDEYSRLAKRVYQLHANWRPLS